MKFKSIILAGFVAVSSLFGMDADLETDLKTTGAVTDNLQRISVTIKSGYSEGSGVIFTRKIEDKKISFVWTAAHVVDALKTVREVIDPSSGVKKSIVEFKDASIVQEVVKDGKRVGEYKVDAEVVKYSGAHNGHDLALLKIAIDGFTDNTVKFYNPKKDGAIVPIGTKLYHVGSLLGQQGANSLTNGILSSVGRKIDKTVFDQTTANAFPGSSGGGIFLEDGRYVGMLVRGAGETFNLIVPIRRIYEWATEAKIMWAIDPTVKAPTLDEIDRLPPEDVGLAKAGILKSSAKKFPTFIIKKRVAEVIEEK